LLRRTIFGPLSGSTYRDTSDRRLPPLLDPDLYPRSRFPICRSRFSPRCDRRRGVSRRLSPLRRRRADARGVLVLRRPDTLVRLWHPVTLGVPAPAISGQVAWQKFPSPKDLDREAVALVKEQSASSIENAFSRFAFERHTSFRREPPRLSTRSRLETFAHPAGFATRSRAISHVSP